MRVRKINAMTVVACNRITEISTEALASYPRSEEWNFKIFSNRGEALDWLLSEKYLTIWLRRTKLSIRLNIDLGHHGQASDAAGLSR
jgi:hypothetical protein